MNAEEARQRAAPVAKKFEEELLKRELAALYVQIATRCDMGMYTTCVDSISPKAKERLIEQGYKVLDGYDDYTINW